MSAQNIYYLEEKKYAINRLIFLVVLTFLSFIFFEKTGNELVSRLFLSSLVLAGLVFVSLSHYAFIVRYPHHLLIYRKSVLIILDLIVLTLMVGIYEQHGIYLLPLYALIVMFSSSRFGLGYFYLGIVVVTVAGATLLFYSSYWLFRHYWFYYIYGRRTKSYE